ncbi:MAG: hypothetical protein LBT80_02995 [Lactobacillaceae bacterium]|jgi:hypothetical protein|nr:hypothetical protein [Lactobacillaceae bacterium]
MKLHTLGPVGTDSQRAAKHYLATNQLTDGQLILHASFEEILLNLAQYQGDQILMPVAFKSNQRANLNWADFNYVEWEHAKIVSTFAYPLLKLSLIENTEYKRNLAVLHAATEGLMKRYLQTLDLDNAWGPSLIFVPSKPVALTDFIEKQTRYTIVSEDQFTALPEAREPKYQIRQQFEPNMIWVVYQLS